MTTAVWSAGYPANWQSITLSAQNIHLMHENIWNASWAFVYTRRMMLIHLKWDCMRRIRRTRSIRRKMQCKCHCVHLNRWWIKYTTSRVCTASSSAASSKFDSIHCIQWHNRESNDILITEQIAGHICYYASSLAVSSLSPPCNGWNLHLFFANAALMVTAAAASSANKVTVIVKVKKKRCVSILK